MNSTATMTLSDDRQAEIEMGDTFTHIAVGCPHNAIRLMLDNEDAVTVAKMILNLDQERKL